MQKTDDRRIKLRAGIEGEALIITIDNTFEGELKSDAGGRLLSTKPNDLGLGIESAKAIAERYNGIFSISQNGNIYMTSVMLGLDCDTE